MATAELPALDTSPGATLSSRLNWLRAGVLGANDGIVSTAGIVMGVAGATASDTALLIAGLAGMVAGALSMATGEYVSVSTQRDTERATTARIRKKLSRDPQGEKASLAKAFAAEGLSSDLSRQVAEELSSKDPVNAHARFTMNYDPEELTNPWHAAWASMLSFTVGALIPLIAMVASPQAWRVPATVIAVMAALALTGSVSAGLGGAGRGRAVGRVMAGGLLAMLGTYAIGALVGLFL